MSDPAAPAGAGTQLIAAFGPLAPYAVELLLPHRVPLAGEALVRALGKASGAIQLSNVTDGALSLAYLDHRTDFAESRGVPMTHLLAYAEGLGDVTGRAAALQQTWDWTDASTPASDARNAAKSVMGHARAVLLVCDAAGLQRKERLELFQRLVRTLVARLPVLAIHWTPSQRIVAPAGYLAPDPVSVVRQGPVNVRLFKVLDGEPGDMVMDTLGLTAFGLRDLQLKFRGLDPGRAAGWHYQAAHQVFVRGDFMKHRDTVDGVGAVWRCHHEQSVVAPARQVIDLRPDAVAPVDVGLPLAAIRCPTCGWQPDPSSRWECDCGFMWNTFDTRARCPACDKQHLVTRCPGCHASRAHDRWYA